METAKNLLMNDYSKCQRLFVESALESGLDIDLNRQQTHYLLNVLRMKNGATIRIFNGRHGEWLARLYPEDKKHCRIELVQKIRSQTQATKFIFLFAPLKHARFDYMVQKAVEMGVGVLQPVLTEFTQMRRVNMHRMRKNTIEAAEQCGILALPDCYEPIVLQAALNNWPENQTLYFCDEQMRQSTPIAQTHVTKEDNGKIGVLIGPEAGFSEVERNRLLCLPCVVPLSLGPRILRADTAGIAALAIIQSRFGDWPRF